MTRYVPKAGTLRPIQRQDGYWEIHDAYGFYDGPYESEDICWIVIRAELEP